MTKLADYAWARPGVATLKADGFVGVLRYGGGGSPAKWLSDDERAALHGDGLVIGLAFEGEAARAMDGKAAGVADVATMEAWADSKGYPKACPLFYAVDFEASWNEVKDYFAGVAEASTHPFGAYGSYEIVQAMHKHHPKSINWQTVAWSDGKISKFAVVYQEAPANPGYNTDTVRHPVVLWGGSGAVTVPHPTPPPAPKPKKAKGFSLTHAIMLKALTYAMNHRTHPYTPRAIDRLDEFDKAEAKSRAITP